MHGREQSASRTPIPTPAVSAVTTTIAATSRREADTEANPTATRCGPGRGPSTRRSTFPQRELLLLPPDAVAEPPAAEAVPARARGGMGHAPQLAVRPERRC